LSGLTPASAVGKDFFQQVAPSTAVKEFRGKFEALRSKGPGRPCYTTLRFQLCWRRNACWSCDRASCRYGQRNLL